jgi:hypothetical protein
MKKKDVELLQWFIDFAYCDFDRLQSGELAKLMTEIRSISVEGFLGNGINHSKVQKISSLPSGGQLDPKSISMVKKFQKRFQNIFEEIMNTIKRLPDCEERDWIPYEKSESILGVPILNNPLRVSFNVEASIAVPFEDRMDGNNIEVRWNSNWRDQATFSLTTNTSDDSESMILYIFFKFLAGVPLKSFKCCEECGHWFLHVSKKYRIYCNNHCAARRANRERRKSTKSENPAIYQKELEKSRERAKKSYDRKVTSTLGPKAKIQRRNQKTG